MDERRKNPYMRTPGPDEQAPSHVPSNEQPPAEPPARASVRPRHADGRQGLRQLPPDMQDLADGKTDRLRRARRPPPVLEDSREGAVIAGVRNAEARAVYDAHVARLRAALASGDQVRLDEGLLEAQRLGLWRARNVTDFHAFAESVIGVPPEAIPAPSSDALLPEEQIALLIRLEASVLPIAPGSRLRIENTAEGAQLNVSLPLADFARGVEALESLGRAALGLSRFLRADPREAWDPTRMERPEAERRGPRPERGPRAERAPFRPGPSRARDDRRDDTRHGAGRRPGNDGPRPQRDARPDRRFPKRRER